MQFITPDLVCVSDPIIFSLVDELFFSRYTTDLGTTWWKFGANDYSEFIGNISSARSGVNYIDLDRDDKSLYIFSSGIQSEANLFQYDWEGQTIDKIDTLFSPPFYLPAIVLSKVHQGNLYFSQIDYSEYPSTTQLTKYSPTNGRLTKIFDAKESFYQMTGQYANGHMFESTDQFLYFLSIQGKKDFRLLRVDSDDHVTRIFPTRDSTSEILDLASDGANLYSLSLAEDGMVDLVKINDDDIVAQRLEGFQGGPFSFHDQMEVINGELYFTVYTNEGNEVWWSNGIKDGASQLEIPSATQFEIVSNPTGQALIFAPIPGNWGMRTWLVNPDQTVTEFETDVSPASLVFQQPFYFKENLVITAREGTPSSFKLILLDTFDFQISNSPHLDVYSYQDILATKNHIWYSKGDESGIDVELWNYDGAVAKLVSDIYPGCGSSFPRDFYATENHFYFSADDGTNGRQMYSIDLSEITATDEENLDLSRLDFQMDPNPAADRVSMTFESWRNIQLNIMDIAGRVLYHHDVRNPKFELSLVDFSPGIYLISATDGKEVTTKKLIIY